jgi:hypothetical protein
MNRKLKSVIAARAGELDQLSGKLELIENLINDDIVA